MKIVTTFHPSSSVLASVKCRLASRDLEHLVVAKHNRIDVFSIQPRGLQHESGLEIWGKIATIKHIPIPGSVRSNLLLLLAHPDPELIFLSYSETEAGSGELNVKKQLSLYERTPRPAEFFNDVLVHDSGKLAVVSCYTGKLKIINIKAGNYHEDFDVSLPELNVFGLTFLPTIDDEYSLAILHIDHQDRVQLLARDLNINDLELSPHPSTILYPTPISSKILPCPTDIIPTLIPIPASEQPDDDDDGSFLGGVVVAGGRRVLLFELASREGQEKQRGKRRRLEAKKKSKDADEIAKIMEKEKEREGRKRKPKASVDWPWSEVTAWCALGQDSLRYIISDSYGKLSMISLDNLKDYGLVLIPLGETSPATTLTYLTTQTLYLGSHLGDSKLLQISQTPTSLLALPTLIIPSEIKRTPPAALERSYSGKGKGRAVDGENMDVDSTDPVQGCVIETLGSYINVLENFKNIAPIWDAVVVDTDGSGQNQIVTASGGRNTGSINVVRNGADFQELANISGLTDITNVWAVKAMFDDTKDTHILVSTLQNTYFFRINDAVNNVTLTHINNPSNEGFKTNTPTLAFSNVARRVIDSSGRASYVNSSHVVQVTPNGAFLLEFDIATSAYVHLAGWEVRTNSQNATGRPLEIVAASVNPSQVLLATTGGTLVALSITDKCEFRVVIQGRSGDLPEISAISCIPMDPTKCFTNVIAVAYWGTNVVEIFSLDPTGFVSICKSDPLTALVRSLLLYNFGTDSSSKGADYHPYLLAGLADGSVVSFSWKANQLKDQKVIFLGHAPVCLTAGHAGGQRTVFAAGNRATVFSWEKKRLHNSPIMLKEITAASRLNTESFKSSLVLSTPSGLYIGRVGDLDKMHIRSISLGLDNPRRILYQPALKVFGIACSRTEPGRIGDSETARSSFRLLDDTSFTHLSQFNCEVNEEITAITTFSPTLDGKKLSLFCLGTYIYKYDEKEPTDGRLLIFTAYNADTPTRSSNLQLSLLTACYVKGCVYSLTVVDDMIVAAVNSSVKLYRLKTLDDVSLPSYKLQPLSEWNHNYVVTSLASYGEHVMAGDHISSVSILKIVNSQLTSVARDFGPLWPISIEASDERSLIAANDAMNLSTFSLSHHLGRVVLERDGSYYLADLVTKFIRGSLTSADVSTNVAFESKHIFFTSSGRIGIIIDVAQSQMSLDLSALQRNLAATISGVGGTSHTRYRAPKNTRGRSDADPASFGFLDGEFLEQFLSYLGTPEQVKKIIAGHSEPERLTASVEELQRTLETLQSMH